MNHVIWKIAQFLEISVSSFVRPYFSGWLWRLNKTVPVEVCDTKNQTRVVLEGSVRYKNFNSVEHLYSQLSVVLILFLSYLMFKSQRVKTYIFDKIMSSMYILNFKRQIYLNQLKQSNYNLGVSLTWAKLFDSVKFIEDIQR